MGIHRHEIDFIHMATTPAAILPPNMMLRGKIYYVRLQLNGRDIWRSTGYGIGAEKSAIRRADELRVQIRNKRDWGAPTVVPTVRDWAGTYRSVYRDRYRALDESIFAPLVAQWGSKRLDAVRQSHCLDYLKWRGQFVKASTLIKERSILQGMFQKAIEDELLVKNPWKGIKRGRMPVRLRLLTHEAEDKLRMQLTARLDRWLTFLLYTGLRCEEASAISIHEIDLTAKLIHVPAEAAKGGKARTVPLFAQAEQAVETQQATEGLLWPCKADWPRKALKRGAFRAGIPHLSPHDLRHTFATRYLQGGGNIKVLSLILGHSSVKITEDHYQHLLAPDLVKLSAVVDWGATAPATAKTETPATTRQPTLTRRVGI